MDKLSAQEKDPTMGIFSDSWGSAKLCDWDWAYFPGGHGQVGRTLPVARMSTVVGTLGTGSAVRTPPGWTPILPLFC